MLHNSLQQDVTASLKRGDTVRVGTIRFLLAAIRNAAISKYGAKGESSLTDDDIFDVIKKQVKSHRESIEAYQKAGRAELVDKETGELTILESFLPKQMPDEELKKLLEPIASSGEKNFGLLMKQAMNIVKGRVEGGRVASLLKQMVDTHQGEQL